MPFKTYHPKKAQLGEEQVPVLKPY
jgi:hypothetical protein